MSFPLVLLLCLSLLMACRSPEPEPAHKDDTVQSEESGQRSAPPYLSASGIYEPIDYVYTEDEGISGFVAQMEMTTDQNVTFLFADTISQEDRKSCIETTKYFLSLLSFEQEFEVYVFERNQFPSVEIREAKVFTSLKDWQGIEYLTDIILACHGPYTLYGLAYGYAAQLLNIIAEKPENLETSEPVLELNLLCFLPQFSTPEEIASARYLSSQAVAYILEAYGGEFGLREILKLSGSLDAADQIGAILSEFYMQEGIYSFSPIHVLFRYGGYSFDYVAATDYGKYYIGKNWKEDTVGENPTVYENFLHKNYPDIYEFFRRNIDQVLLLQQHIGKSPDMRNYSIVLSNFTDPEQVGGKTEAKRIKVNSVASLLHEYVHAIVFLENHSFPPKEWINHGYVTYYESSLPNYYEYAFMNLTWNNARYRFPPRLEQLWHAYEGPEVRQIDMEKDALVMWDLMVLAEGNPRKSALEGTSLINYLVQTYGEDTVSFFMFEGSFDCSVFDGKTEQELWDDWYQYLLEKYPFAQEMAE